jgi:hypothetical protein
MMGHSRRKRVWVSTITGAVLGIFCIVGIGYRIGYDGNWVFLASAWFNRVVMGAFIGLAGRPRATKVSWVLFRGAFLGGFISFAWFLSTGFLDPMGFAAGVVYGMIIDLIATRYARGP